MGYMSQLDEARRCLVAGDFHTAETLYWKACEEWEGSRVRGPILEKGVEPLLRMGGRIFGRDPGKPVFDTFERKAPQLLEALREVASVRADDAVRRAEADAASLDGTDVASLGEALFLHRESRLLDLPARAVWPVVRAYLHGARRHGLEIDPTLLPTALSLDPDDLQWLVAWAEGELASGSPQIRRVAGWLLARWQEWESDPGRPGLDGRALAIACRLAQLDPSGGPRALDYGLRALRSEPAPPAMAALLRVVAGLACNEDRLATGCLSAELLEELAELADIWDAPWPAPRLREMLEARDIARRSDLVAVAWDGGREGRLLVLRLRGTAPADAMVFRVDSTGGAEDPFSASPVEARRALSQWVATDAAVLTAATPPAWVRGLLDSRPIVDVGLLESALPAQAPPSAPEDPVAPHPLWEPQDALATEWTGLLRSARSLVPRLDVVTRSPAFRSVWGLGNLRRLGDGGLDLAQGLAAALTRLGWETGATGRDLVAVPGSLPLNWPPLAERPWPRGRDAKVPDARPTTDLLRFGHPTATELAGWAGVCAPCELVTWTDERALAIGDSVASLVDPRTVTVAPERIVCPEPLLGLLDRWIESAVAQEDHAVDVLWLMASLATLPEGDLSRWVRRGGRAAARSQVDAVLESLPVTCDDTCRLHALPAGCLDQQLARRRTDGSVWIETLDGASPRSEAPCLLVDDLVPPFSVVGDDDVAGLLERLRRRLASADVSVTWVDAPHFAAMLTSELARLYPHDRVPRIVLGEPTRELDLHWPGPGYSPGSLLLAEEANRLLEARIAAWAERPGEKVLWLGPGEDLDPASIPGQPSLERVRGASPTPTVDTVLLPRLARASGSQDLVVLLRLAAAATHARQELICLDPRLVGGRQLVAAVGSRLSELRPRGSLSAEGRTLLDQLPPRRLTGWEHPVTEVRLAAMEESLGDPWRLTAKRRRALVEALGRLGRGGRWVIGGLEERERELVALTVARLAAESGDGGPLEARCVVWVCDRPGSGMLEADPRLRARRLETVEDWDGLASAVDRNQLHLVSIPESLASAPETLDWVRRRGAVLWFQAHGERLGASSPLGAALADRDTVASGTLLVTLDATDPAAANPLAEAMRARAARVEAIPVSEWRWNRIALEDPPWPCASCAADATLAHAHAICPKCGQALLRGEADREASREASLDTAIQWLRERGQEPWLVVAATSHERERIESELGWEAADAPLLESARDERGSARWLTVVTAEDLWSQWPPPGKVALVGVPSSREELERILRRLRALGYPPGELAVLDHPLQWSDPTRHALRAAPVPGFESGPLRWAVPRAEVEFRTRQAMLALARTLRAGSGPEESWPGLGPDRDPRRDPGLEQLTLALETWWPETASWWGASVDDTALQTLLDRGRARFQASLEGLEELGLTFGAREAVSVSLAASGLDETERRALGHWITWMGQQGLMAGPARGEVAVAPGDPGWLGAARATAAGESGPLPAVGSTPAQEAVEPTPEGLTPSGPWVLGVAGSGKTEGLRRTVATARRGRALILVPRASSLAAAAVDLPSVEIATTEEFCLAFLRRHHRLGGFEHCPRLLPGRATGEGRAVRETLLRQVSRLYAEETGRVPAAEVSQLWRVLEGEPVALEQEAHGEALDFSVLRRCAERTRWDEGWLTAADLRHLARRWLVDNPYVAEAWRDRYPTVLVEDADALHPDELAFIDAMFPPADRVTVADPLLLDPHLRPPGVEVHLDSWRMTKDQARTAARLLPPDSDAPRLRGRRRGRFRMHADHVLNLEACARRIQEAQADRDPGRTGVVVAHRGDVRMLAARLREAGERVWLATDAARAAAPGPREFLALLGVLDGLESEGPERVGRLAQVVLARTPLPSGHEDPGELGRILASWWHGLSPRPRSVRESFLEPLCAVGRGLAPETPASEVLRRLQRTHLLEGVRRSDAASGRLERYVEDHAAQPWTSLIRGLDPEVLLDPQGPGRHLWILSGEDLPGMVFDNVYYLCTGHEPGEPHYRVLARTTRRLHVLYSERDPYRAS